MKIIVGLGNPGEKYKNTRHNVGFLGLDRIMNQESRIMNIQYLQSFKLEKKLDAEIAKLKLGNTDIILVKPQTFMNLSGKAVKKILDFYKIKAEKDLIVIHDDIDLEFGKVKIKNSGSSAGHNGVQSIIDELGTENFIRVRIGIGRPINEKIAVEDWVLMGLSVDELKELDRVFEDLIGKAIGYLV